jgi:hypothetical protein
LDEGRTQLINVVIISILPMLNQLIVFDDLVFSVLSLLALIVERNPAFIKYYKSEGIIENVFKLMNGKYST